MHSGSTTGPLVASGAPKATASSIPRVLHRVWLGDSALPEQFRRYGDTWVAHHPGWDFRLWTDTEVSKSPFSDAVARGGWPSERSNLLRYEVLRRFGGVYIDTDVECLKPIDPLLVDVDLMAAWEIPGKRMGNAVLASTPGHPLLDRIIQEAHRLLGENPSEHSTRTGPPLVTRVLTGSDDVTILGPEVFYPPIREKDLHRLEGIEPPLVADDARRLRELACSGIAASRQAASYVWPERTFAVHHVTRLGRERYDPSMEVERLRILLEKAAEKERKLRDHVNAIEASAWWRFGTRLGLAGSRERPKRA